MFEEEQEEPSLCFLVLAYLKVSLNAGRWISCVMAKTWRLAPLYLIWVVLWEMGRKIMWRAGTSLVEDQELFLSY